MIEVIFSICMTSVIIGLLVYLYFHEKEERAYIKSIQTNLTNLPVELQKFYAKISEDSNKQTQKVLGESFTKYLKHIQDLEKMVLPKPVTTRDVKRVMSRIGEVADESLEVNALSNEIEKAEKGIELPKDDWTGFINADTKVAFEEEDIPTIVE